MFDLIKDDIRNGRYGDAYNNAQLEKLYLHGVNERSILRGKEDPGMEVLEELSKKFSSDPAFIRKKDILTKLADLIFETYLANAESQPVTFEGSPGKVLKLPDIDTERDNKIIEKIEVLESEALNIEGWAYTEQISANLRKLVDECKTKDENYINQLSYLIQAMEDEFSPILLLGESGVGKSKLAEIFHSLSKRKKKEFVQLNCGSFSSEDRLNQNLFGWEKGSHSTADKTIKGKIEIADGGTLFLDDIDRLPKDTRDALLTFIDTNNFQRLGAEEDSEADVCLIIGTNKNPKTLVAEELLEEDFYYRISKRVIHIPPLRNRKNDINIIADYYLTEYNTKNETEIEITDDALELIKAFPWKGNFRILENYLEIMLSACKWRGESHLTPYYINNNPPDNDQSPPRASFNDFENLMLKFLTMWNSDNGNFVDEFLRPLLAKLYTEDYHIGKNQNEKNDLAISIVDMDGKSKRGSLHKNYIKYGNIKLQFSNK